MAANDNVTVRIVGDASGVAPAVNQAEAQLAGMGSWTERLGGMFSVLGAKINEAFGGATMGGEKVAAGMRLATAATDAESNALTRMILKVHEGAESVRTFQMRAKEFAELYVAMFGIETVNRWAESIAAAAEKTAQLAARTGMTTSQIQALSGAATMSGTSIDVLEKGLAMLDNRAVTSAGRTNSAAKALKAMGIEAQDGTTSMQRLLMVADKFHNMADGPEKVALSMQLFSRAGRDMIPFLNQGGAAIQDLMEKTKEYGAVSDKAQAQGEQLAESVNLSKIAWEGLKNILIQSFGPVLVGLVDDFNQLVKSMEASYESGGAVKQVFDVVVTVLQALGEMVETVGMGLTEFFQSTGAAGIPWKDFIVFSINVIVIAFKALIAFLVLVGESFMGLYHAVKSACETMQANVQENVGAIKRDFEALGMFLKVVGKVMEDALHLNWGSIQADWDNGMAGIQRVVQQRSNQILATTAHLREQAKADMAAAMGTASSFDKFADALFNPKETPHETSKFKFGGGTGDVPNVTSPPKGPKDKAGKDDLVQKLEEELEAKKVAWEEEQLAQNTAQEFSLESEQAFWAAALKRTDLSAKDKLSIEKKWIAASQALQKEAIQLKLDGYKRELTDADKNEAEKLKILQREAADIKAIYGANSKEARAADQAVAEEAKRAAEQRIRLINEVAKAQEDADLAKIDEAQKNAEFEVEMGRKTQGQLLQMERQFENERFQIYMQGLLRRKSQIDPFRDPEAYQKINTQIEESERQHQQRLTEIDRKAALQRTQIERGAISSIASGWGQAIGQMLTLQKSFAATIQSLWQTLQQAIGNAIASIIQNWLTQQLSALLLGKAAHMATAKAEIMGEAAKAGAGGVASMAAAPFPMDLTAPGFGASMAAAAAAYGAIPSGAGGMWDVKEGLNFLHKDEMVLPAWAASPLRDMIASKSANNNSPAAANDERGHGGGSQHLHLHGKVINRPRDIERWFRDNWRGVGAGAHQFARNGGISGSPR